MNRTPASTSPAALLALVVFSLPFSPSLAAQAPMDPGKDPGSRVTDSTEVARVVEGFHEALASGDSVAALGFLGPGVRILEGGGVQTLQEYAAHHLGADMAFATAVPRERGPLHVTVHEDVAWVSSTNTTRGSYRGRDIDSRGAELAVLSRHDGAWRIEAVSWSSR